MLRAHHALLAKVAARSSSRSASSSSRRRSSTGSTATGTSTRCCAAPAGAARWSLAPRSRSHGPLASVRRSERSGGAVLLAMGVLVWTDELFRLNIEAQHVLDSLGLNFFNSV
jgi:hypothetical protein